MEFEHLDFIMILHSITNSWRAGVVKANFKHGQNNKPLDISVPFQTTPTSEFFD